MSNIFREFVARNGLSRTVYGNGTGENHTMFIGVVRPKEEILEVGEEVGGPGWTSSMLDFYPERVFLFSYINSNENARNDVEVVLTGDKDNPFKLYERGPREINWTVNQFWWQDNWIIPLIYYDKEGNLIYDFAPKFPKFRNKVLMNEGEDGIYVPR